MRPPPPKKPVDVNALTRKIAVDNRLPLKNYYRIADNLLKQANIYRSEKNILDLYYQLTMNSMSSLASETIPSHRDYQASNAKDKAYFRKMLFTVLDELESLKPEFRRQLNELEKVHETGPRYEYDFEGGIPYSPSVSTSGWAAVNTRGSFDHYNLQNGSSLPSSSWQSGNEFNRDSQPTSIDTKLQKLSLGLPPAKEETLSRHSLLGPSGLRGKWTGPTSEIKVTYPSYSDLAANEIVSLNQVGQDDSLVRKDGIADIGTSTMESVLSLDDGRWRHPAEETDIQLQSELRNNSFSLDIRQPSPPPVLAQVHPEHLPISPSRVADPRPGPAKSLEDGMMGSGSYNNLHIPVKMMEDFLRLARENTSKNLETCGVLAGSLVTS
ncbi:hypothetical protein Leryth_021437 [Lithospermum erythrorhizon]|nr:hypothetical protein Leryth_021437 [Lithospermum erythrorhizon]